MAEGAAGKAPLARVGSKTFLMMEENGKHYFMWLGAILKNDKWIWAATGEEADTYSFDPDAERNDLGISPTTGYNWGYINTIPKWRTWNCKYENVLAVCGSL